MPVQYSVVALRPRFRIGGSIESNKSAKLHLCGEFAHQQRLGLWACRGNGPQVTGPSCQRQRIKRLLFRSCGQLLRLASGGRQNFVGMKMRMFLIDIVKNKQNGLQTDGGFSLVQLLSVMLLMTWCVWNLQ